MGWMMEIDPMSGSLSKHFEKLGAPLKNFRWSWGAARADDVVFLRVWQDQCRKLDKGLAVRVTDHVAYEKNPENAGRKERLSHVRLLAEGRQGYAVMCKATDKDISPRKVASFDRQSVFSITGTLEIDGDTWALLGPRVPVAALDTA